MTQTANPSPLIRKLDGMAARYEALREQLADPAVLSSPQRVTAVAKESGQLSPVIARYREYQAAARQIDRSKDV